jgi:hypothetical protein
MPANLRRVLLNRENIRNPEWMHAHRADSAMRVGEHKERILDNFRRRLEAEAPDSDAIGRPQVARAHISDHQLMDSPESAER